MHKTAYSGATVCLLLLLLLHSSNFCFYQSQLKKSVTGLTQSLIRLQKVIKKNTPKISLPSSWKNLSDAEQEQWLGVLEKIDNIENKKERDALLIFTANPQAVFSNALKLAQKNLSVADQKTLTTIVQQEGIQSVQDTLDSLATPPPPPPAPGGTLPPADKPKKVPVKKVPTKPIISEPETPKTVTPEEQAESDQTTLHSLQMLSGIRAKTLTEILNIQADVVADLIKNTKFKKPQEAATKATSALEEFIETEFPQQVATTPAATKLSEFYTQLVDEKKSSSSNLQKKFTALLQPFFFNNTNHPTAALEFVARKILINYVAAWRTEKLFPLENVSQQKKIDSDALFTTLFTRPTSSEKAEHTMLAWIDKLSILRIHPLYLKFSALKADFADQTSKIQTEKIPATKGQDLQSALLKEFKNKGKNTSDDESQSPQTITKNKSVNIIQELKNYTLSTHFNSSSVMKPYLFYYINFLNTSPMAQTISEIETAAAQELALTQKTKPAEEKTPEGKTKHTENNLTFDDFIKSKMLTTKTIKEFIGWLVRLANPSSHTNTLLPEIKDEKNEEVTSPSHPSLLLTINDPTTNKPFTIQLKNFNFADYKKIVEASPKRGEKGQTILGLIAAKKTVNTVSIETITTILNQLKKLSSGNEETFNALQTHLELLLEQHNKNEEALQQIKNIFSLKPPSLSDAISDLEKNKFGKPILEQIYSLDRTPKTIYNAVINALKNQLSFQESQDLKNGIRTARQELIPITYGSVIRAIKEQSDIAIKSNKLDTLIPQLTEAIAELNSVLGKAAVNDEDFLRGQLTPEVNALKSNNIKDFFNALYKGITLQNTLPRDNDYYNQLVKEYNTFINTYGKIIEKSALMHFKKNLDLFVAKSTTDPQDLDQGEQIDNYHFHTKLTSNELYALENFYTKFASLLEPLQKHLEKILTATPFIFDSGLIKNLDTTTESIVHKIFLEAKHNFTEEEQTALWNHIITMDHKLEAILIDLRYAPQKLSK